MNGSVRSSVTSFSPCSHCCIIMKFSGIITNETGNVHAKGQGQKSKVMVTEVRPHIAVSDSWLIFEFTYDDEIMRNASCCLVTRLKLIDFDTNLVFPDYNSSLNSPMAMKLCTKLEVAQKRCPIIFQKSSGKFQGTKNCRFYPNWAFPDCKSSLISRVAVGWCTKLYVA